MMMVPGLNDKPPLVILLLDDGSRVVVVGPRQVADVGPRVGGRVIHPGLRSAVGTVMPAKHVHLALGIVTLLR